MPVGASAEPSWRDELVAGAVDRHDNVGPPCRRSRARLAIRGRGAMCAKSSPAGVDGSGDPAAALTAAGAQLEVGGVELGRLVRCAVLERMRAENSTCRIAGLEQLRRVATIQSVDVERRFMGIETPSERSGTLKRPSPVVPLPSRRLRASPGRARTGHLRAPPRHRTSRARYGIPNSALRFHCIAAEDSALVADRVEVAIVACFFRCACR